MAKESKETYYEVDSSTEELFMDIFNKKSIPFNIKLLFQGNSKQKQLIKVTKIPDQYAFSLGKELLISIFFVFCDFVVVFSKIYQLEFILFYYS